MPVTKTAKRALRGSKNKARINKLLVKRLEVAVRIAKRSKSLKEAVLASSLADRAAKRKIIHKNKAARIKSQLSKITAPKEAPKTAKKTSKKKA